MNIMTVFLSEDTFIACCCLSEKILTHEHQQYTYDDIQDRFKEGDKELTETENLQEKKYKMMDGCEEDKIS